MRFGVVAFSATNGAEWHEKALRHEAAGFEYLFVPDHLGLFDPFAAVAAASAATNRLRVGALVLNVEFWNPLLLALVAVTTQVMANGRFILNNRQISRPRNTPRSKTFAEHRFDRGETRAIDDFAPKAACD